MKTKKNIFLLFAIILFYVSGSKSQNMKAPSTSEGEKVFTNKTGVLRAGIGVPNILGRILIDVGGENVKSSPVFSFSYEQAVSPEFSVGGYFGFSKVSNTETIEDYDWNTLSWYTYSVKDEWTVYLFGIKGDYHFGNDKYDGYAGGVLGYGTVTVKQDGKSVAGISGFVYFPHVGIRYPFSKNVGVFAELGYGIQILNAGLAISFGK